MKKLMTTIPIFLMAMIVFAGVASAHVHVSPGKVAKGTYQTFTFSVPSEKEDVPTVKLKMEIPEGVSISRVMPKANWQYELKKNESGKVTSVIWKTTGDGLASTEFTLFKMEGKVSQNADTLKFKTYQTYKDGSVVKWVGKEVPMVKVSAASMNGEGNMAKADQSSNLPLYLSIAAIILGIIAVIVAAMKKKA